MTLSTTSSRIVYLADGVLTSFAAPFKIWAASNLAVYTRDPAAALDVKKTFGLDYTTDIATYPNTGSVVFTAAPPAGTFVVIEREMPLTQELDLIASGDFAAENVETQLDKLVAELQTLRDMIARAPLLPVSSAYLNELLPPLGAAAVSQLIGVNATGDGYTYYAPNGLAGTVPLSAFALTLLDDTSAAAMRSTLGSLGGAFTVDFASTVDNAVSTAVNVTVTGARPGDHCAAVGAGGTLASTAGISIIAKCLANDTVRLEMVNDSGSTFDPASQSVNVLVVPHF